jgi:hypothetical protein
MPSSGAIFWLLVLVVARRLVAIGPTAGPTGLVSASVSPTARRSRRPPPMSRWNACPTKQDLLRAIMKELVAQVAGQIEALAAGGDASAVRACFAVLVDQAADNRTVVVLLEWRKRTEPRLAAEVRRDHRCIVATRPASERRAE